MQRALLQYSVPANHRLVVEALKAAGREDLIGFGKNCLVRPCAPAKKPEGAGERGPGQKAAASAPPAIRRAAGGAASDEACC